MKSKFKKFWHDNKDLIIGATVVGVGLGIGAVSMTYLFKALSSGGTALPIVTNEGVKHTYALGGPNSPMRYQLTEEIANAYNRAGKAVEHGKAFTGNRIAVVADKFDMAAWNYVAKMTKDHIASYGPIPADNVFSHYLTRI